MKHVTSFLLVLLGGLLAASPAAAQTTLRDALGVLMTNQAVQTADFEKDREAAEAASDTIARALLVNLTSAPISTSSGRRSVSQTRGGSRCLPQPPS